MTSLRDVERVADELDQLTRQLRSEMRDSSDFHKLAQLADRIGERADRAAETFSSIDETLAARIAEIKSGGRTAARSAPKRAAKTRQRASK